MELNTVINKSLITLTNKLFIIGLKNLRNFKHLCRIMREYDSLFAILNNYRQKNHCTYLNDKIAILIAKNIIPPWNVLYNKTELLIDYNFGLSSFKINAKKNHHKMPYQPFSYYISTFLNNPKVIKYLCYLNISYVYNYTIYNGGNIKNTEYLATTETSYSINNNRSKIYYYKLPLESGGFLRQYNKKPIYLNAFIIIKNSEKMSIIEAPKEALLLRKLTIAILKIFSGKNLSKLIGYYL